MRSTNQVYVVLFEELFDHRFAESVWNSAIVFAPTWLALLRVRPQQIAQEAILRDFSGTRELLELGNCNKFGRETSVHAQNLVVNESRNGHTVEDILELFPRLDWKAAFAFVVETINAVDLTTFVISAQQEKVFLVLDLVREQQNDRLQRLTTSVYVVAEEEVVGFGREPAIFKQSQQIGELTVGVTWDNKEKGKGGFSNLWATRGFSTNIK